MPALCLHVMCFIRTDTTVRWTKNTQKTGFFFKGKNHPKRKNPKTLRNMPKLAIHPSTRGLQSIGSLVSGWTKNTPKPVLFEKLIFFSKTQKLKIVQKYTKISDTPFDQRSLIHWEAWFPPCFVGQNQPKQFFFFWRFQTTSKQKCSNLRPLFPKDSESLKTLDIRLREVGAKRRLNGTSKVKTQKDGQTDTLTRRGTFQLIESIGPEGQYFENQLFLQSLCFLIMYHVYIFQIYLSLFYIILYYQKLSKKDYKKGKLNICHESHKKKLLIQL